MQVIPAMTDQDLIKVYLKGNDSAFEELLNRHKAKIYSTIYMFVKDHSLAEDIMQDVFIKIIDTLRKGKYNHEGKFVQWAMRIAYNMCVDNFRRNKRRSNIYPTDEFDIFDVLENSEEGSDEVIMKNETYHKVRRLVDMLPAEQREVVILRHYADMSFKEISALTNVSINTALGRMRYALINIRKMMEEKAITL